MTIRSDFTVPHAILNSNLDTKHIIIFIGTKYIYIYYILGTDKLLCIDKLLGNDVDSKNSCLDTEIFLKGIPTFYINQGLMH